MSGSCQISLCLIARNEEHCLSGCLASASQLVDEIILVDTGSADKTMTIAAEYGARIFPFEWADDFAAARNYAISQAHGKWILVLDADEKLTLVTRPELLDFIAANPAEGYYFNITSFIDLNGQITRDQVVRLFKNNSCYRFTGAIHEQVVGSILSKEPPGRLLVSPFTIEHYGYLPSELAAKCKFRRNTDLLVKALLNSPQDAFLHYSLAIEYLQNRDFDQAGESLEKMLPLLTGTEGYLPQLLGALLLVKLSQPHNQQAEHLFKNAIHVLPDNGDFYCLFGMWLMQRARYEEAIAILEPALKKSRELTAGSSLTAMLGDACYLAGRQRCSIHYFLTAITETPQETYSRIRLFMIAAGENSSCIWEDIYDGLLPYPLTLAAPSQPVIQFALATACISLELLQCCKTKDPAKLTIACSLFLQLQPLAASMLPANKELVSLLMLSTEVLLLQGEFIVFCGNQAAQHSLEVGILHQLRLIAAIISQSVPANPVHFWEEVFIGEASHDRQPD